MKQLGSQLFRTPLADAISVGVHRMQRNFEPMRKQVEVWRQSELTDVTAKAIIYQVFIDSEVEVPLRTACEIGYADRTYDLGGRRR